MASEKKSVLKKSLPLLIQTGVGLITVGVIWVIILYLPMIKEVKIPTRFTLSKLITAVIMTTVIAILIRFGILIKKAFKANEEFTFPLGLIMSLIAYLLSVLIGYFTYKPLIEPYLPVSIMWVYPVAFLVVFVVFLGILGYIVFSSVGTIAKNALRK